MEEQVISNPKSELWSLSIKDLFYKYLRFLPLFLLSLAFALLIAWIYLRYTTRIYGANGTMLINNEKQTSRTDKAEDILIGNSNRNQNIQNEIEVLKSKPLMARVIKRLHLEFTYNAIGKIKEYNAYKQTPFLIQAFELSDSSRPFTIKVKFVKDNQFRIDNGATIFTYDQVFKNEHGVFRFTRVTEAAPGMEYNVKWEPIEYVAAGFASGVRVLPKTPGTSILSIGLQTTNAQMAADIVNSLMVQYDSMTIEQNNFSTDQMLSFIDERLKFLDRQIDSIQQIKLKFQLENDLIDVEAQLSLYMDNIRETDKLLNEQEAKYFIAGDLESYLQTKANQFSVVPSSLGLEDLTLVSLIESYNKAQLARQTLLNANVTLESPLVKQVEGEIEKLRESILENIRNIRSSFSSGIGTLRKKNQVDEQQFKSLPNKMKQLVEITRQLDTKQELYKILQAKREEAAITRSSTISNSKVIDVAGVSNTPVKPNKRTIQIIAVLIGLGLPALLIFIGEVANDKVSTRYDIERITNAAILGEVGHSYSENTLIVNKTSRSMVAEQFRIIRSNLQYILPKSDKSVILVTSSFSGEGKSFISTNMGAVLALTGKKTVILEFDIRKPKVLSGLGMSKKTGISNYLVGKAELDELIIPVPNQDNLYVLPCGPIPPNPSELLLDVKVQELFNWLRDHFDVIIIDTAPVGMVSDAMTLGKFADCTLYLVRQGHTYKKQVALIDELYRDGKLPKVSIIINDVKIKPGYGYYGYGRYGYGYGYGQTKAGSYYEEEKPPESSLEKFLGKLSPQRWFRRRK